MYCNPTFLGGLDFMVPQGRGQGVLRGHFASRVLSLISRISNGFVLAVLSLLFCPVATELLYCCCVPVVLLAPFCPVATELLYCCCVHKHTILLSKNCYEQSAAVTIKEQRWHHKEANRLTPLYFPMSIHFRKSFVKI
jgi:hypothetical protein